MRFVNPITFAVVMFLSCIGLSGGGKAFADYYKYTDKSGAVCITNNLEAVPPKYRVAMKVIREETLAKKDKGARPAASQEPAASEAIPQSLEQKVAAPPEPTTAFGRLVARFPWSKPLAAVLAILTAFFFVRKLSSLLSSALLARVIYLSFFLALFVFVYKSYAEHVTNSYFLIKKKMIAMYEKANRREMPEPGAIPAAAPEKGQTSQ